VTDGGPVWLMESSRRRGATHMSIVTNQEFSQTLVQKNKNLDDTGWMSSPTRRDIVRVDGVANAREPAANG